MARTAKRKMSAKKKFAAVMASILALALLIGGAFAWTDFSQSAINRFRGNVDPDVTLHDDFEPNVNKDVYVENTGEVDLIVRVKFNEYFQIGNVPIVGGNANDKDTWETHMFPTGAQTGSIPAVVGELDDNCKLDSHEYFSWLISGATKIYKPGTGEMGNYTYIEGQTFPDNTVAKPTLPEMAPITMAEYIANKATYDAEANGRWILDTDGWCYWSKLLVKDTATNLLLDNVVKTKDPDDNYLYNIDVILQASNVTEAYLLVAKGMSVDAENNILGDLTGVIKLKDGTKIKDTETPKFYEVLDNDGKSRNPREFLYDPDDNIKDDKDVNGDEKPAVKGKDNEYWIDNEDGTFTNYKNNLDVIPPAGQMPGGNGDVVQTPSFPIDMLIQPTQFRVLPIAYKLIGTEFRSELEFVNPSQAASAQPLRYLVAETSKDYMTISQTGYVTIKSTVPDNTICNFYVIAADGSVATGNFVVRGNAIFDGDMNQAVKMAVNADIHVGRETIKILTANGQTSSNGTPANYTKRVYTISSASLGCSITPDGLFKSGTTTGTVTVTCTASFKNLSRSPITLEDGTSRIIPAGDSYNMTATINVIIDGVAAPEGSIKTKLTDLGVTSWTAVEPAPSYASGTGTAASPYKISSIRQLKKLENDISVYGSSVATYQKYFELTANLDFAGADQVAGHLLGGFQGTFDGKDHIIKDLTSTNAIFSNLSYGTLKNLGRTGGSINPTTSYAGGIIQTLGGNASVIRCYNTTSFGNATASYAGGIVANASNVYPSSVIENCYNKGNIQGNTAGGIISPVYIGATGTLTIKDCYNSGTISGIVAAGGIVGAVQSGSPQDTFFILKNVRNYGNVTRISGAYTYFGGILGRIMNPSSSNYHKITMEDVSYAPGKITYTGTGVQADKDIGANHGLGTGGSLTGAGTNDLTGSAPAGFLV